MKMLDDKSHFDKFRTGINHFVIVRQNLFICNHLMKIEFKIPVISTMSPPLLAIFDGLHGSAKDRKWDRLSKTWIMTVIW